MLRLSTRKPNQERKECCEQQFILYCPYVRVCSVSECK